MLLAGSDADLIEDAEPADLVLTGATVLTMAPQASPATALAIRDGLIVAVGSQACVSALIGPDTQVYELAGRTVLPGINDSHLHAAWLGAMWPATLFGDHEWSDPQRLIIDAAGRRAAILRAGDLCLSLGITSYTEPGLGPGEDDGPTGCFGQAVLDEYLELAGAGALRCRVTVLRLFGLLDGRSTLADFASGLRAPVAAADARWLNVRGVKIFADGIPPMRSAWTHGCYPDGSNGELLVRGASEDEREVKLRAMIELAHAAGQQIGVHATGDRTIDVVVDALATATGRDGRDLRHYLVHADLLSPRTLDRMARHGIGVTTQPAIAVHTSSMMAAELGTERAGRAWPLATMLAATVPLTLSSDAPVVGPDWRLQVAAAGAWMGRSGVSAELMMRLLRCYTIVPAAQDGAEQWKGSIERGKVADLCILAENPLTVDIAELPAVPVDATIVAGNLAFERAGQRLRTG